ncbi:MAG TPA: T9SS type A sorting domain-containing protein, partial [Flavitalea sp.]|nr:T9SS type A sorting domain-containing protein [Flavitalea sp.]
GMSAGANIVMEYVGSSINRARRVAAVSVSSLCAPLSNYPNGGQVIAQAHLPVWMIHCASDDPCGIDRPQGWFNAINANESPANPNNPIFTQLNSTSSDPNLRCRNYTHNTWSTLYNSAFRVNGANFMEWSLASVNAALPVKLKSFEASLVNGKVFVKWSTLTETGNAAFTIEKSADGRQFSTLKTIDGVGNSNTERKYEFIDDKPLTNLSYYRLLQTDVDGHQEYSSIKKILNQKGIGKKLIVSPNPFINELSAFVVLDKKQRLVVTLSDMNGHRISQVVQMLSEGSSEISLPVKSLNKGIYLLKVEGETISETMKVVKQ